MKLNNLLLDTPKKVLPVKFGMWLFLIMDGLTFYILLSGCLYLRIRTNNWPHAGEILNIPLTSLNTFILIISSFTMVTALNFAKFLDLKNLKLFLTITIFLGLSFITIQLYEYYHLINGSLQLEESLIQSGIIGHTSLTWASGIYGSTFYIITGFHGLHVLSGIIYLLIILFKIKKGIRFTTYYDQIEIAALFWHFVDLVWIMVFTIIYLI